MTALEERNLIREMVRLGASDDFCTVLGGPREEKEVIQSRTDMSRRISIHLALPLAA